MLARIERAMETRNQQKATRARQLLSGLVGVSCVLSFDDLADVAGEALPAEANSAGWWTGASGWNEFAAARVCQTEGWCVESVRTDARLVRLVRVEEEPNDGGRTEA